MLALFLAAVLAPAARWLEDRGWPPAAATAAPFAGFVLVLGATGVLVTMSLQAQLGDLVQGVQELYREYQPRLDQLPLLPDADQLFGAEEAAAAVSEGTGGGQPEQAGSNSTGEAAMAAVGTLGRIATEFALFLVIGFFYVKDRERITRFMCRVFPRGRRGDAFVIADATWQTVAGYIRAQMIIAPVDGAAIGIGLALLDVPLAAALGVVVFTGAFVPVVGAFVSGGLAVGVALAANGLTTALLVLALVVAVQQLEGHVLAPVVLGRQLALHPIAVVVALTTGAVLLGIFGAIVAVPLTASVYRAVTYLNDYERIGSDVEPAPDPVPTGSVGVVDVNPS